MYNCIKVGLRRKIPILVVMESINTISDHAIMLFYTDDYVASDGRVE